MKPKKTNELISKFYESTLNDENLNSTSSDDEDFIYNESSEENSNSNQSSEDDDDDNDDEDEDETTINENGSKIHNNDEDIDDDDDDEFNKSTSKKSSSIKYKKENHKQLNNSTITTSTTTEKKSIKNSSPLQNHNNNINNSNKSTKTKTNDTLGKIENNFKICCVCLNSQSETTDELVECDSCGFYAHEGCYGMGDTDTKISTNSIASTEPWFCNSCLIDDYLENGKDSLKKQSIRECELCPNIECGLLKETDSGRFVHIVCALYTPRVAFQDTDKLWPVVLDEIGHQRWGENVCSLCDNIRYSRTGICIKCDAGLCKTYFHVTCAQKHGYLVDPMQQNSSDPYLAYCKQHEDKTIIKSRKTNYLAMISNYNYKMSQTKGDRLFQKSQDKERLLIKFKSAKQNYQHQKEKTNKPFINNTKVPRMLTYCPSALKMLISKTSLTQNFDEEDLNGVLIDQQIHTNNSVTFTCDFVKYYFEREKKMPQLYKELETLRNSQSELTKQEIYLRNLYETKFEQRKKQMEEYEKENSTLKVYVNLIEKFISSSASTSTSSSSSSSSNSSKNKFNVSSHLVNLNQLLNVKLEDESTTTHNDKQIATTINNFNSNHNNNNNNIISEINDEQTRSSTTSFTNSKTNEKKSSKNSELTLPNLTLETACSICNKKFNSHLLVDCDTCKNYYHINCLEPPLNSVPKKTKLYGWECSKCVRKKDNSSDYDGDDGSDADKKKIDINAPRMLRRERRKPKSLDHSNDTSNDHQIYKIRKKTLKLTNNNSINNKKKRGRKPLKYKNQLKKESVDTKQKKQDAHIDLIVLDESNSENKHVNHKRSNSSHSSLNSTNPSQTKKIRSTQSIESDNDLNNKSRPSKSNVSEMLGSTKFDDSIKKSKKLKLKVDLNDSLISDKELDEDKDEMDVNKESNEHNMSNITTNNKKSTKRTRSSSTNSSTMNNKNADSSLDNIIECVIASVLKPSTTVTSPSSTRVKTSPNLKTKSDEKKSPTTSNSNTPTNPKKIAKSGRKSSNS